MADPFSTALSALSANSVAIAVTGDNLANLNTTGFKSSRVTFGDLVVQFSGDGLDIGAGVGKPSTQRDFAQGSIQATTRGLDAALQGSGFFVIRDSNGVELFTRAGSFSTDSEGHLITLTGNRVQGWSAVDGEVNPSGPIDDIIIPTSALLEPVATTEMALRINLDANAEVGTTFAVPSTMVDSLGATHTLTYTFTKTSATDWDYEVTIPGEDLTSGTPGTPSSLGTGTISFDTEGQITTPAPPGEIPVAVTGFTNGSADATVNWSLFDGDESLMTQYAQASALSSVTQDGETAGELIDIQIGEGGVVVARFTGGREEVLAQLAVGLIANPDTLASAGGNNFRVTADTATPAIGPGGTGGRGNIRGNSLEASTADIAQEFTNLIRFQRAYQANSRVVTTADEVAQETLNLKR